MICATAESIKSECLLFDKFAFKILAKLFGSNFTNSLAVFGGNVHTNDDLVALSGSNAIGPVGKNFWYAVSFPSARGCANETVPTTPICSYSLA